MPEELIFLPEVRQDIADAYSWYEEQTLGLGLEFLRCLEASFLSIQRNPLIYHIVHEDYRRALIRRFPYAIFYEHNLNRIIIYSVFHCSRNPAKWQNRIR